MMQIWVHIRVIFVILISAVSADESLSVLHEKISETSNASSEVARDVTVPKVVGGNPVNIYDYPFMVSIRRNYKHYCGGTLYTTEWVLTAAHCLHFSKTNGKVFKVPVAELSAWAGASYVRGDVLPINAQECIATDTFVHPQYNSTSFRSDIGLMRLEGHFELMHGVRLTKIPLSTKQALEPINMGECHVAGWGYTEKVAPYEHAVQDIPETLMEAKIVLLSKDDCGRMQLDNSVEVRHCTLCGGVDQSGGRDACQGDSGGPLLCRGTQVGVVSSGFGCALNHMAGIYTRIDCYLGWIIQVKEGRMDPGSGATNILREAGDGLQILQQLIGAAVLIIVFLD